MTLYVVSYDICEESREHGNGDAVLDILSSRWGNSLHIQGSVFFIETDRPAAEIIFSVRHHLASGDKLIVVPVDPAKEVVGDMSAEQHRWIAASQRVYKPPRQL